MSGIGTDSRKPIRILIAEDDPLAAEVLQRTAGKVGVLVETVANGLDAADRIAACPPDHFDAVLLDMRMPIMDGREAARRIRDLSCARGSMSIYAMSASEAELLRHPWATWLFDGHLTKPLNTADFETLIATQSGASGRADSGSQRSAISERIAKGAEEIEDAVQRADYEQASDAARRMRLALLGLVSEDLIRALHVFQLSQAHGRKEEGSLDELRRCVAGARQLLIAA